MSTLRFMPAVRYERDRPRGRRREAAYGYWPSIVCVCLVVWFLATVADRALSQDPQSSRGSTSNAVPRETSNPTRAGETAVDGAADEPRASTEDPSMRDELPRRLKERWPRLIYAREKDGTLVPVVDLPWEELEQLLEILDGADVPRRPPPFHLTRLKIEGQARDTQVDLQLELQISTVRDGETEENRWVRIPLGFPEGSLLEQPEHTGGGQLYVNFDEKQGYEAWLLDEQRGDHQLKLRMSLPIDQTRGTTTLRLTPPVATQSQLTLDVAGKDVTADVENAKNLVSAAIDESHTRLTMVDMRNVVVLSWRAGTATVVPRPQQLDVRGDIRVTIDGPSTIRSQVVLDVQSYGRPIEQFTLRLPPQTTIVSGVPAGFELRAVSDATSEGRERDARAAYQVTLQKPATQTRLQLTTQTVSAEATPNAVNVASFDVVDAIRQSGQIVLFTSEEWLVYWTHGPDVARIVNAEGVALTGDQKLAGTFRYYRQPCRLDVEIKAQETRVDVRPTYRMHIAEDRVNLEAQLDYKLRGARRSFLEFALRGWTLDDVGPSGAVENDDLRTVQDDTVRLRLTKPTSGELSLTLRLSQPLSGPSGTMRMTLPVPQADRLLNGVVLVTHADAVVPTFRLIDMPGLVPTTESLREAATEDATPDASSAATPMMAFHSIADRDMGEMIMDYQVHEQEIRVRMDHQLDFANETVEVQERLSYRILYRPANQLTLDLPRPLFELLANPRWQHLIDVRVDDRPWDRDVLDEAVGRSDAARPQVSVSLDLPQPRLGDVEVTIRFPWRWQTANIANPTSIPLAIPRDGRLLSHTATLNGKSGLRLEPLMASDWTRVDDGVPGTAATEIQLSSLLRAANLQVRVTPIQDASIERSATAPAGATIVQRGWIQTWLSADRQEDRIVLRIATGREQLRVRLPASADRVRALVDGQPTAAENAEQEWTVYLPKLREGEATLELFVTHRRRPPVGRMQFALPVVVEATGPDRWFWQLLVPSTEHLWSTSPQLSLANAWVRDGWWWRRDSPQSQAHLEEWMSATSQPPIPAGLNNYLFTSFEKLDGLRVSTCSRRALVYGFSLIVLLCGCAWVYLRALRHPVAILALGVCGLALAWLYADVSWLVLQASGLGIVLSIMAQGIAYWTRPRSNDGWPRGVVYRTSDPRGSNASSWREGSGPHTTVTIPSQPLSMPASDSKA